MATRRQILSWSLAGATALSGGIVSFQWLQEEDYGLIAQQTSDFHFLTEEDVILLAGLVPAVIGEKHLTNWRGLNLTILDLMGNIDTATRYLSQATRDELRQLFDLLWHRLGKLILAGIWSTWSAATVADVDQFLGRWRSSWIVDLNNGYLGIQQLIFGAFLTEPGLWEEFGYDGPPW